MCFEASSSTKGRDGSSIRCTGSVCRHQSVGAAQSRFRHPVRSRIRCRARICACSVSRRLAASLQVTPQVPLPSSMCLRPLLSLMSRVFRSNCIPNLAHNPFQFSRHIVQNPYPRRLSDLLGLFGVFHMGRIRAP